MNKEQIVVILERLEERKIDVEDAIFDISELVEDNSILEELEALELDDENFEIKVKGLISLVKDSDVQYRKASYKDIKRLLNNSSLKELDDILNNLRSE